MCSVIPPLSLVAPATLMVPTHRSELATAAQVQVTAKSLAVHPGPEKEQCPTRQGERQAVIPPTMLLSTTTTHTQQEEVQPQLVEAPPKPIWRSWLKTPYRPRGPMPSTNVLQAVAPQAVIAMPAIRPASSHRLRAVISAPRSMAIPSIAVPKRSISSRLQLLQRAPMLAMPGSALSTTVHRRQLIGLTRVSKRRSRSSSSHRRSRTVNHNRRRKECRSSLRSIGHRLTRRAIRVWVEVHYERLPMQ